MAFKTILIVSHDAGGGNLLAYWCARWQSRANLIYMVSGPALEIFKSINLAKVCIEDYPSPASVDFVVTSTGWQSNFEYDTIKWAKQHHLPCASYLDHWVNYENRFRRGGVSLYPDEIWVGDQDARNLATEVFNFKRMKLRFIRNQYFCELKRQVEFLSTIADSVLICLEPIRNGISYSDVYLHLVQYLANSKYRVMKVVIRDHPSGTDTGLELLKSLLDPKFDVTVSQNTLWQDLSGSCAVVGYQSSVLAYACYLKLTAISYFPIEKTEPKLPHDNIEYIYDIDVEK